MHRDLGQLRIIGGQWRSRRIEFDAADGVRPTPDRVRQTVFDWLAPLIDGARCLDLFAGSGALGLEALSRGASTATFVEHGAAQVEAIGAALGKLDAGSRAELVRGDAVRWLAAAAARSTRFDIIFIDPPYDAGLLAPVLEALPPRLAPTNRLYLEWPKGPRPELPGGYRWLREKAAGRVSYGLVEFRISAP